jgi:hypothetical protein
VNRWLVEISVLQLHGRDLEEHETKEYAAEVQTVQASNRNIVKPIGRERQVTEKHKRNHEENFWNVVKSLSAPEEENRNQFNRSHDAKVAFIDALRESVRKEQFVSHFGQSDIHVVNHQNYESKGEHQPRFERLGPGAGPDAFEVNADPREGLVVVVHEVLELGAAAQVAAGEQLD